MPFWFNKHLLVVTTGSCYVFANKLPQCYLSGLAWYSNKASGTLEKRLLLSLEPYSILYLYTSRNPFCLWRLAHVDWAEDSYITCSNNGSTLVLCLTTPQTQWYAGGNRHSGNEPSCQPRQISPPLLWSEKSDSIFAYPMLNNIQLLQRAKSQETKYLYYLRMMYNKREAIEFWECIWIKVNTKHTIHVWLLFTW